MADWATMKRFLGLLRTTWWLWLVFAGLAVPLIVFVDPVFWVTVPIYAFTFFYFAFMRFDEQGNHRE